MNKYLSLGILIILSYLLTAWLTMDISWGIEHPIPFLFQLCLCLFFERFKFSSE